MSDRDEVLRSLIDRWEEARAGGQTISAEDLCKRHPQLLSEARAWIDALKASDWLDIETVSGSTLPSVVVAAGSKPADIDVHEFRARLECARLLDDEQQQSLGRCEFNATPLCDVKQIAASLVERGWLTPFQVQAILAGRQHQLNYGDYSVLRPLGGGGMGQVFLARHRHMDRLVALKIMSAAVLHSTDAVQRFQREVRAAARLTHPNIVTAYDAGQHEGVHYLIMEYIEGHNLSEILDQRGPLPIDDAVDYLLQTARGLAFAHNRGVVHRDIKPANLLLGHDRVVKILDMGLARLDRAGDLADRQLTATGQVMGTVDYMAPEQAFDTRLADARSDNYSLGCTFYRLLTNECVYGGQTLMQKLLAHRNDPIPALRSKRPEVPEQLDAMFQKMVAKQPTERYQHAAQLVAELESLRAARTTKGTVALPSAESDVAATVANNVSAGFAGEKTTGPRRSFRRPIFIVAAGFAVVALILAGLWPKDHARSTAVNLDDTKLETNESAAAITIEESSASVDDDVPPVSPETNLVYLDDLTERSFSALRRLGKHGRDNTGGSFTWQGQRPAHALYAHALPNTGSQITYDLQGKFERLRVTAALADSVTDRSSVPLTFRIVGDGKTLRESPPLQHTGDHKDFIVPVRGVRELRLEVVCPGYNGQAHSVWVNPRLSTATADSATPFKKGDKPKTRQGKQNPKKGSPRSPSSAL